MKRILLLCLLLVFSVFSLSSQETGNKNAIFADIGLGVNYSVIDQKTFLTPQLGLEFFLRDNLLADIGLSVETHSTDYSGIQKIVNKYISTLLSNCFFYNRLQFLL